jgi:hypothetical protein
MNQMERQEKCPHCGRSIWVKDGLFISHYESAWKETRCPGSKQSPKDEVL